MSQSRLARNKNSNFGKYNDLMKIHQMVQQSLASLNIKNYSIRNVQDAPTSVPTIPGEPKWIHSIAFCLKCYKLSSGQLNKFLHSILPHATDYAEQLEAKISSIKENQIKSIYEYFFENFISLNVFKQELEKSLKELRNKLTPKIYDVLKNHMGCIFTEFGEIIPFRYDTHTKKYVLLLEAPSKMGWRLPSAQKSRQFVIMAHTDTYQQKRVIQELKLDGSDTFKLLHKSKVIKLNNFMPNIKKLNLN